MLTDLCDRATDPIFVRPSGKTHVMLRIGGEGPGEGRYAVLTAREAKLLAYELLATAEKAE